MTNNYYQCASCGQKTSSWNEGQCPNCMTLDSLYDLQDVDYIGSDWETYNTEEISFINWD